MHHVIRRIALPLLAALALTPATALADDAFQDLSNGAPGGPAFVPPPPPTTARRSTVKLETPEQADSNDEADEPLDPRERSLVVNAQLLGASLGFGLNIEGRLDRWIVSAGVAQAYLGGTDDPDGVDNESLGFSTPFTARYLMLTDPARRHALDFGLGIAPMWGDDLVATIASVGYRGEFDVLYVRGGLDLIGLTNQKFPPVPFLPMPNLAVGARF